MDHAYDPSVSYGRMVNNVHEYEDVHIVQVCKSNNENIKKWPGSCSPNLMELELEHLDVQPRLLMFANTLLDTCCVHTGTQGTCIFKWATRINSIRAQNRENIHASTARPKQTWSIELFWLNSIIKREWGATHKHKYTIVNKTFKNEFRNSETTWILSFLPPSHDFYKHNNYKSFIVKNGAHFASYHGNGI